MHIGGVVQAVHVYVAKLCFYRSLNVFTRGLHFFSVRGFVLWKCNVGT